MADLKISPNVSAYPDEEHSSLHIEIELPGIRKENISFKLHDDSFYIRATKEGVEYVGSYAVCCPVSPSEAKAKYEDGLLTVDVPYKDPMVDAVEVQIE
ncbi:MAG TPA: Hsp20/alpha crystallin family protein [Candidatus Lokiarchaeia archaeon]|nr:Hsp20/alpha crystallin family protein [Candidatus Lokiarchaeia archaeon]